MDCQVITDWAKWGCGLGKAGGDTVGREGNGCEVLEGGGWSAHQKDCPGPGAGALDLTTTFRWLSSGLASSQCSLLVLYETWPTACSHWCELGTGPVERSTAWLCKTLPISSEGSDCRVSSNQKRPKSWLTTLLWWCLFNVPVCSCSWWWKSARKSSAA